MKLKDLKPGDEFVYKNDIFNYRKGRFLVLGAGSSYLRPAATEHSRFIFSYTAKTVVNHFEELAVVKKEVNVKPQNQMGHFVGWKFGVPVRIHEHNPGGFNYPEYEEARLIHERDKVFVVVFNSGAVWSCSKQNFYYELIPYNSKGTSGERYPICSNNIKTAYCNSLDRMSEIGFTDVGHVTKALPAASIIVEGLTIELSAETTANFKEQLGI